MVSSEEECRWEGEDLTSSGEGGARCGEAPGEGEPPCDRGESEREGDSRLEAARRSMATACERGVVGSWLEEEYAERLIEGEEGSIVELQRGVL